MLLVNISLRNHFICFYIPFLCDSILRFIPSLEHCFIAGWRLFSVCLMALCVLKHLSIPLELLSSYKSTVLILPLQNRICFESQQNCMWFCASSSNGILRELYSHTHTHTIKQQRTINVNAKYSHFKGLSHTHPIETHIGSSKIIENGLFR